MTETQWDKLLKIQLAHSCDFSRDDLVQSRRKSAGNAPKPGKSGRVNSNFRFFV